MYLIQTKKHLRINLKKNLKKHLRINLKKFPRTFGVRWLKTSKCDCTLKIRRFMEKKKLYKSLMGEQKKLS